jgi:hypothetical protein
VHELRLEGSAAHKESIDVGLGVQQIAVGSGSRATVDDAGLGGDSLGDVLSQPCADFSVGVLGLLGGGAVWGGVVWCGGGEVVRW